MFDFECPHVGAALSDGAALFAHTVSGTAGPARFVSVYAGDDLLACAAESGLSAAVRAAEEELRAGGPLTPDVRRWLADGFALMCFFPYARAVTGDATAAHALDELLLLGRAFEVRCADGAFRFRAQWTTELGTPREIAARAVAEHLAITWLHGDWLFLTEPRRYRTRARDFYARTEALIRPADAPRTRAYPTHRSDVTATGRDVCAAVRAALPAVAEALAGEAEWRARFEIVSTTPPIPTDDP